MSRQYDNYGRDQINIENQHIHPRSQAISTTISERRSPVDHWQKRHGEEQAITEYLTNANTRLIGLVGAGGYGKSALASQMMDAAKGFDEKLWANFEAPVAFSTFALWLLRKLMGDEKYEKVRELYQTEPPEKLLETAIAQLQSGRYLLVLDNLETVQRDDLWQPFQNFLEKWLGDGKSTSKIVLTTQAKVALSRAEAWEWLRLGGLETSQGVKLLSDFGIEGSEAELREFVEIAEGHPLLLRCAASSLILKSKENYEVAAIYRLKQDDLTLLQEICGSHRGDPTASVGKVLDRSFSYLESVLQVLLLRLSVLRGSFGLAIAQSMIDEPLTLEELRKLARWSFVQEQRDGEAWAFSFLPLVKRYLVQRSQMDDQEQIGHRRAIAYFTAKIRLSGELIADCAKELEIFHHCCELGEYAIAACFINTCFRFLYIRGDYHDLLPIYKRLTQAWTIENSEDVEEQKSLGWVWVNLGTLYHRLGQYRAGIAALEKAQIQFSSIDCSEGESACLDHLGNAYQQLGQPKRAISFHQQSLEIDRRTSNRDGEGGSLCNLGNAYRSSGQVEEAIKHYQQALVIQREVRNRQFESESLRGLGVAYCLLGQYKRAIDCHQQQYEIECEIGHRWGEGAALFDKAQAFAKYEPRRFEALTALRQAREIFIELELDHMVEECDEAIRDFNQIIATEQRQSAPVLPPTPTIGNAPPKDDWYERSLPTKSQPRPVSQRQINWVLWFCVGIAIALLIAWLRK